MQVVRIVSRVSDIVISINDIQEVDTKNILTKGGYITRTVSKFIRQLLSGKISSIEITLSKR